MRRFLDLSIDLLGILDLETRILEMSESWGRTFGWSREDLLGTPLVDYFHQDDLPQVQQELATLLEGGEAVAVVVRIRTKDGAYRWVQGNARSDLAAGRIYVTAADITDRKELEDALRDQLLLEEHVATVTARLVACDAAEVPAVIERGIGELARLMGADRAHFLRGRNLDVITFIEWLDPVAGARHHVPAPEPEVQQWWLDVLRSGELLRLEDVEELADSAPLVLERLRDDGVRSVLVVPLPPHRGCWGFLAMVAIERSVVFNDAATALLQLAGESFLTALGRGDDAAALLDARRELEHRNEELERSNEELERFAYAAAHDLQAPLGRIEMALKAAPVGEGDAAVLLGVALRGAARMRQLIDDLLVFATIGTGQGEPEAVDLDHLVAEVLADLQPTVEAAGATVEVGPLGEVWGHATPLVQLVQNLLGNALKFTRPGVAPVVQVSARRGSAGTTLRVADNGPGIAPARRAEVFGVFTRLDPHEETPGSGIGLATCAKVVASHGGQIHVEDGIDGGMAMVVQLPHRAGGSA
jgi:PAS domain S-box-containing protein